MVTLLQSILLGIVQGLTEWLPVSSSGHLVIIQQLFNMEAPLVFDIWLHVGTLLVIFLVFWQDILNILKAVFKLDFKSEHGRLALFIILGSIPTAIIGFAFEDLFTSFFTSLTAVGIALLVTGTLLFVCERGRKNKQLTTKDSIIIGTAQGLSIIPGISRSGSTIGIGLLMGLERQKVARFSFLLAIPAIVGATIFKLGDLSTNSIELSSIVVGTLTATIVGYLSLKLLLTIIKNKGFHYFAWYCWAIGLALLIFQTFFPA